MSRILVTGSVAYDTVMNFHGKFADHILPDKVHMLNVAFLIGDLHKNFGGTAGNIAYNLSLLGMVPKVMASVGRDFWEYENWMKQNKIDTKHIKVHNEDYTAQAYITTDDHDNQITAFHPGAMSQAAKLSVHDLKDKPELVIVAPNDTRAMVKYCKEAAELKIKLIFDPGQQITAFSKEELASCLKHANYIIVNDYELELILKKTGLSQSQLLESSEALIVTKGHQGSIIITATKSFKIPAFPAEQIVDPTGCGDAYRAGLIYGLLAGLPWEKSGRLGSLIAAYKISHQGTQTHSLNLGLLKEKFQEWTGGEL